LSFYYDLTKFIVHSLDEFIILFHGLSWIYCGINNFNVNVGVLDGNDILQFINDYVPYNYGEVPSSVYLYGGYTLDVVL